MNEQFREQASQAATLMQQTDLLLVQIKMLAKLHEEGILTDEEFTAKKQELLARL